MIKVTRCHTRKPSPYLKKVWPMFVEDAFGTCDGHNADNRRLNTAAYKQRISDLDLRVVDIGGGNGRNILYLQRKGFTRCTLLDAKGDYGVCWDVWERVKDPLPFVDGYADVILLQYVMMFLPDYVRTRLLEQIKRIASAGCFLVCELQWLPTNENSHARTPNDAMILANEIRDQLGWDIVHDSKYRFVARKPREV